MGVFSLAGFAFCSASLASLAKFRFVCYNSPRNMIVVMNNISHAN
jgi:hypothetical protein